MVAMVNKEQWNGCQEQRPFGNAPASDEDFTTIADCALNRARPDLLFNRLLPIFSQGLYYLTDNHGPSLHARACHQKGGNNSKDCAETWISHIKLTRGFPHQFRDENLGPGSLPKNQAMPIPRRVS
jgi:hypothetical protein